MKIILALNEVQRFCALVVKEMLIKIYKIYKQEAHGPPFAHLSDIATADMQMLCNIFSNPIIPTNENIII